MLKKILLARATAMLGDRLVKLLAAAVLTIFVARVLGASELGIYSIVMAWSAFLVPLTSMGLNNNVIRRMVQQQNGQQAMTLLYSAVTLRLALGLMGGSLMLLGFYLLYPDMFSGNTAIAIPVLFLLQSFFGLLLFEFYLNYQGTFRSTAYLKTTITLCSFGAKLALLYSGFGIASLLLITGIEFMLVGIAQYLLYRYKQQPFTPGDARWPPYHPRWFDAAQISPLLKRASWLWLSGIVAVVYLKIDIVMLGAMAGTEQAGIYAAASRLSELWYVFPATLATRYYPDMLKAYQQGLTPYYLKLRRFALLFFSAAFSIALLMTVAAPWLISLLFGDDFSAAIDVLRIHIWAGCFIFVRYLISQHLVITEQEQLSLLSHGIGALLNIGLNFWLIPSMGIVGAAWATLVSYAFASFFFLFIFASTRAQLWQLITVRKTGHH
ncbi:Membrane protein involved in the export of O-antigen and teichoic acid [Arsukibacterium tuosuense]|uniref:Membrane protein involved in the export of O-antigen and teichoic acid n=1 Tax=Arsukibacterium tuosuense TaxID=1323745 RepID=A0A285I934_9GAMM|nr:flippase [Arsukibacterium tuosuense]SNY44413.1 Membrane protein involved in the export of O-antigen and teichoic acid [Arsukibacterium tuosuense]